MATYTTETVGRRIYILGNTFPVKDRISAIGGTFDGERRAWWVGTSKRAQAEQLVQQLNASPPPSQQGAGADSGQPYTGEVRGKARYKGRDYFVRYAGPTSRGGDAFHLVTGDGKISFWTDAANVQWTKRYEKRGAFGKIDDERGSYPSLASIQRFKERNQREAKQTGIDCWKCRKVYEQGEAAYRMHLHDGCDVCGAEN